MNLNLILQNKWKHLSALVCFSAILFSGFMAWDLQTSTMHQEIQKLDHAFAEKMLAPHPDAGWWVFVGVDGKQLDFCWWKTSDFFPPGIHLEACIHQIGRSVLDKLAYLVQDFHGFPRWKETTCGGLLVNHNGEDSPVVLVKICKDVSSEQTIYGHWFAPQRKTHKEVYFDKRLGPAM